MSLGTRLLALIRARKVVRGLQQGLSEDERHAVAEHAQLTQGGDPWRLKDEAKPAPGPTTSRPGAQEPEQ